MPLSMWVVFPSAITSRANMAVEWWRKAGYQTLVYQDLGSQPCKADVVRVGAFPGYYRIINALADYAVKEGADLVTCAADDMMPDQLHSAQEIGELYFDKFPSGDGVFQATGDMQGTDGNGVQAAARICGSPLLGREWISRAYEGRGPFWDDYHSFYADEDLLHVAKKCNLLWQEPSLTILHKHWSWNHMPMQQYHLRNQANWQSDHDLFYSRKLTGFQNSEMLPL